MRSILATYLGQPLCLVRIAQQNSWILGQPPGTGGLNTTSKPNFVVSNNDVPVPIAKKEPKITSKKHPTLRDTNSPQASMSKWPKLDIFLQLQSMTQFLFQHKQNNYLNRVFLHMHACRCMRKICALFYKLIEILIFQQIRHGI